MKTPKVLSFVSKPVLIGLCMFFFLLVLTQFLSYERYLLVKETDARELNNVANSTKERLQTVLSYNLSTAQTLGFIVQKYGVPRDFDSVGAALLRSNKFVDAVQLVKGGVITHVYPLKGNEIVVGFDILKDTLRNSGALTAIKTKEFFWAGPIMLKQGGAGIIGRQPLFKGNKFTGFSAVIIRLPTFLNAVGIDTNSANGFYYQLSRVNEDGSEVFFLPNHRTYKNALVVPIKISNGEWKLYVGRKSNATFFFAVTFSILGFMLSAFGGFFTWHFVRQPEQLNKLVEDKTRQLSEAYKEKGMVLNRITDAMLSLDNKGQITFINQTARERLSLGRQQLISEQEIIGRKVGEVYKGVTKTTFWEKYQEAIQTQKETEAEGFFEPTQRWVLMRMYPSPDGVTMYSRDISESKKAEEEILLEKNFSDSTINSLPGVFYLYDQSGRFVRWNKNFETVSGYSAEEIGSENPPDFFDEEEKKIVFSRIRQALQTGEADAEVLFYTKDKKKIPYYFNGRVVNINGKKYLMGMGIDITERKKVEWAMLESEEKYRSLIESSPDIIMRLDLDEKVQFINYTDGGFTPEQIIGASAYDFVLPEFHQLVRETHRKVIDTRIPQTYETVSLGLDGIKRWFFTSVGPIVINGKVTGITLMTRDITERKKIENEVLLEKNLSESVINSLPGIFYLADFTGKLLRWNKNFEILSGYTAEELSTMRVAQFVDVDEEEKMRTRRKLAIETGMSDVEINFLTKNKEKVPYYFTSILSKYNNEPCLLGVGIDITERKKASESLKESEARYRALVEHATEALVVMDMLKGKFVSVSKSAELLFGMSQAELLEVGPAEVSPEYQPDGRLSSELAMKEIGDAVAGGRPHFEWTHCDKKGNLIPCEIWLVRLPSENQILIRGSIVNISERKRAEKEKDHTRYLLNERVKELTTLYNTGRILQTEQKPIELVLQEIVNTLPSGWQFPEICEARIILGKDEFKTSGYTSSLFRQEAEFKTVYGLAGVVEVVYLEEKPLEAEGPFVAEERHLINMLADMIRVYLNQRYEAEELNLSYIQLRQLSSHLQTIREEERTGIAREIHDELGQQLTALKMDTSWLAKKIAADEQPIHEKLNGMTALIDDTVKTIRRISTGLRPGILDDLGLFAALEWQTNEFEKRTGVKSVFKSPAFEIQFEKGTATGIFRIYQESLTNVMRHAEASTVEASLEEKDNYITLTIRDNGQGFDSAQTGNKKTLGLVGMKERALMFGGELTVESNKGKGTTLILKIPLPSSANKSA